MVLLLLFQHHILVCLKFLLLFYIFYIIFGVCVCLCLFFFCGAVGGGLSGCGGFCLRVTSGGCGLVFFSGCFIFLKSHFACIKRFHWVFGQQWMICIRGFDEQHDLLFHYAFEVQSLARCHIDLTVFSLITLYTLLSESGHCQCRFFSYLWPIYLHCFHYKQTRDFSTCRNICNF